MLFPATLSCRQYIVGHDQAIHFVLAGASALVVGVGDDCDALPLVGLVVAQKDLDNLFDQQKRPVDSENGNDSDGKQLSKGCPMVTRFLTTGDQLHTSPETRFGLTKNIALVYEQRF